LAKIIFIITPFAGLAHPRFDVSVRIRNWMKSICPLTPSLTHVSGMFIDDFIFELIVIAYFAAAASLKM
jgi:hypothetical protein